MRPRDRRRREQREKRRLLKAAKKRGNYPGESGYGEWEEITFKDVPEILSSQRDNKRVDERRR